MICAIEIWMDRAEGIVKPIELFPDWPLDEIHVRHEEGLRRVRRVVESMPLTKEITYQNWQGQTFTNTLAEILLHLHSHSAYHRGQIAQEIRRRGNDFLDTDFILTVRKEG